MTSALRQLPAGRRRRGFTLLELVLVLLLLSTMLAMAVPSLRGFLGNSRRRDAVTQIVALAEYAKARAAADAKVYRLNVEGSTYWIEVQEAGSFVPLAGDFGQHFELPEGARLEVVQSAAGGGAPASAGGVAFHPNGRTDAGLFRLTDAYGDVTLLACPSPAESFRVVSPEEAARL